MDPDIKSFEDLLPVDNVWVIITMTSNATLGKTESKKEPPKKGF